METWNPDRFIHTVSQKIGAPPSLTSGADWGDVKLVQWSHPCHETSTKALDQHFLAITLNPLAEVSWRVNGSATRSASMPKGASTFVPAGRPVDWVIDRPMTVLNFFLPSKLLQAAAEEAGKSDRELRSGREWLGLADARLARLATIAGEELNNGSLGGQLLIDTVLGSLSQRLVSLQLETTPYDGLLHSPLTQHQLRVVRQFMEAHLDTDLRLDQLSATIGLSSFHFSRAFRARTGLSPFRYLARLRVERAQLLLRQTRLSITEVAIAVGLSSQSHLTHVFKRIAGTTPASYRRHRRA